MNNKNTKKSIRASWSCLVLKFALLCSVMAISTSLLHAKEDDVKIQKHRGHLTAIDVQTKTITLAKKDGSEKKLVWDDKTELKSSKVKAISDLKPGMWLRCIMADEKSDQIQRILHENELDKPEK